MSSSASKKADRKITSKQRAFAEHYAIHGNATEAYRRAYRAEGMKPESVKVEAQKLLKHPHVALTVQGLQARFAKIADEQFDVRAERILEEIAAVAFYNVADFFEWGHTDEPRLDQEPGGPSESMPSTGRLPYVRVRSSKELTSIQQAAIVSVKEVVSPLGHRTVEVTMADKLGALKLLLQNKGLVNGYNDREEAAERPLLVVLSPAEAKL